MGDGEAVPGVLEEESGGGVVTEVVTVMACTWPGCLPEEEKDELAEQVRRSMLGQETAPATVDQRTLCGCGEET